jgi:hypothetical protein
MNRFQSFDEMGTPGQNIYHSPQGFGAPNTWNNAHSTQQMENRYKDDHTVGPGLSAEDYLPDSLHALQPSAPRNFNLFVSHPQSRPQYSAQKDNTWNPPRLMRPAQTPPREVRTDQYPASVAASFPPLVLLPPQGLAATSPAAASVSALAQRRRWGTAAAAYAAAAGDLVFANGGGGSGGSPRGWPADPRSLASRSSAALASTPSFRRNIPASRGGGQTLAKARSLRLSTSCPSASLPIRSVPVLPSLPI